MSSDGDDLPRAHIKRIVKTKLNELMNELGPDKSGKAPDGHVQKEALLAFGESAKIFIHYITATANEICRDSRRQTISVDDVFRAIEELEFGEFGDALKSALEGKRERKRDEGEGEEDEQIDANYNTTERKNEKSAFSATKVSFPPSDSANKTRLLDTFLRLLSQVIKRRQRRRRLRRRTPPTGNARRLRTLLRATRMGMGKVLHLRLRTVARMEMVMRRRRRGSWVTHSPSGWRVR